MMHSLEALPGGTLLLILESALPRSQHPLSRFDLTLVGLYLVGITLFGLRFRGHDRSLKSYFLADRSIPWWAISLSIVAAETSTLTIISVPGLAFSGDWGFFQIVLGYLLGRVVVCLIFLPRYFRGELLTAYEVIGQRFGPRLHRLTALLFLFLRAAAEGVRVFAVSIVVGMAIGAGDVVSIAVICVLTLIYTLEGGMAAVVWTDVAQMILYVAGTLVTVKMLGSLTPGGWHVIHAMAASSGKLTTFHFGLNLVQTYTFWAGVIGGCFLTMASHGTDQLMVQRLLAAKDLRSSRIALLASGVVVAFQFALFLLIGTGLYYFYRLPGSEPAAANPDRIFPAFLVAHMPRGAAGLMIAAILAAAMSNLSAAVNSLSSSSIVDLYLRWRPQTSERARRLASRWLTLFWTIVLFVLALLSRRGGHVVETGLSIASVAYGSLLGVFLLGTITRTSTETGAMVGMTSGLLTNLLLWKQSHAFVVSLGAVHFTFPKIAWTWFVLIGSCVTFAVGWMASKILRTTRSRKSDHVVKIAGICFVAWLLIGGQPMLASPPVSAQPVSSGTSSLSAASTKAIDDLVKVNLQAHKLPSAVVVIGHDGKIVFFKSYETPRTTVFDMASMTKVMVTAPAVMQLYEQGRLRLDDPVSKYLPEFAVNGKETITVRQLLTHSSGLAPDLDLTEEWTGKQEGIRRAFASVPTSRPGTEFRYSDINYIVLGALVEKLSGLPLDEYAAKYIFRPLGMADTRFLPPIEWRNRIAQTQLNEDGKTPLGVVHDPTARRMGGVAGHAGLFTTANDVAVFAQNLLDRLQGRPSNFPLKRSTLELMTTPVSIPGRTRTSLRGLGWDIDSAYSSPRGKLFPVGSFGHTGFTGTSLWIDPASETYVIILSNAVFPRGHSDISALRSGIATYAAAAFKGVNERVQTGIDVLEADHFAELAKLAEGHGGRLRLGLLTNQTGANAEGNRTADILAHQAAAAVPGLTLKVLFSPEHGINGTEDRKGIANSTDRATGLPVISLYGTTDAERRPSQESLRQLDAVVIDLQDVGIRFYTYETVVHYFLEEAGETHTDIVVLDRPNPIGGLLVQGPLSDPGRESYVNAMPLPIRHGMTMGELARYFNSEGKLGAPLTVLAMHGWRRDEWFDETGLTWVNPSPNLRSLAAASVYPALGLIETTNLSVGRGTETPFAYLGAPWIHDDAELSLFLTARSIPGVSFEPVSFTPKAPYPFANEPCHGVRVLVTDRNAADMPELGLEIASALERLYGARFELAKMDRLLVNQSVLDALVAGKDPRAIAKGWADALNQFNASRQKYLLY